jgi:hypothetical protein
MIDKAATTDTTNGFMSAPFLLILGASLVHWLTFYLRSG